MLWIDGEVVVAFGIDKPRKLHDGSAGGVDDDAFDLLGVSLDAVALPGDEG